MRFSTWIRSAATVAILAVFSAQAVAQSETIVRWTFEGANDTAIDAVPNGTSAGPYSPEVQRNNSWSGSAVGVHLSASTDWSSPSGDGSFASFSSNNWAIGDYYQFHTNTLGLSNIGLGFDSVSSNTGPRDFKVAYSLNGLDYFDTGFTYQNRANAGTTWSSGDRDELDVKVFDLTGITALNNAADVYFRLIQTTNAAANNTGNVATTGTSRVDNVTIMHNFDPLDPFPPVDPPVINPPSPGVYPQPGDVIIGHSSSGRLFTIELARGPLVPNGGEQHFDPWWQNAFIQSVEFDNKDGQSHNARGNLLGVNFNEGGLGFGTVYSFATQDVPGEPAADNGLAPAGQLIASTGADHPSHGGAFNGAATRLNGVSVSPDNTKIAVTGYDNGTVIVFDYVAGDTMGSGASASGGRKTFDLAVSSGRTTGTAWLDNQFVLSSNHDGDLIRVDSTAGSMAVDYVANVPVPRFIGTGTSEFSDIEYNAELSDYVYLTYGGFSNSGTPGDNTDDTSMSRLYVFDAANNFSLVTGANGIDLTGSFGLDSVREIALDQNGNLFLSAAGGKVFYMEDVISNPAAIADNSAVLWFDSATNSLFNGIDVAWGEVAALDGDYNNDGKVDASDYVLWRKNPGQFGGDPAGYDAWKANFGNTLNGSGNGGAFAAVPEPASVALVVLGLAAVCCGRRRAA